MTGSCEDLELGGDHCYEDRCWLGELLNEKRKNATEWEEQIHACVDYFCDNDKGPYKVSVCQGTSNERRMCINDGCLPIGSQTRVEIDVDGFFVDNVNYDDLKNDIEKITGIKNVEIGFELHDDASVIRVVVLVDDVETGEAISNSINDAKTKCN